MLTEKHYGKGKVVYKKRWRSKDLEIYMPIVPEKEIIPEVDEERLDIQEINCSVFGCGKILSRQEKLFGNKCINHQK